MRCTSPYNVGFKADGKTLAFSERDSSPEFAGFQVPCRKCISCRLEFARSRAIRCVHEAMMHEENCFLTLTYNDDSIGDGRLRRRDWQLFAKRLRRKIDKPISFYGVGEYGELTKRPHWHACVFGWSPPDAEYKYTTDLKHKVFSSDLLKSIWKHGECEFGSVTFESAGYVARYSSKKLVHGYDQKHNYHPIPVFSTKRAIGKSWIEKYYHDVFNFGYVVLENGIRCGIPRFYEDWLKKTHPDEWIRYVTTVKKYDFPVAKGYEVINHYSRTPNAVRNIILESKFKLLQENLKL